MKKRLLYISIIALCTTFSSCKNRVKITGSGNIITKERTVTSFDKVKNPGSINVKILSGNHKIEVKADHNIIDLVNTTVTNNTLEVSLKKGNYHNIDVTVTITTPNIDAISNSGSGKISSNGFSNLTNLEISNDGSGSIDLSGSSSKIEISNSGSGSVNAFNFIVDSCEMENSGSGSSEVFCELSLSGMNSGSGSVYYKGTPNLLITNSGSGSIINAN